MEERIRNLHRVVVRLCPPLSARNVRIGPAEHRAYDVLVRIHGVEALNMTRLMSIFPEYDFFMCDVGGRPCVDVYIPVRNGRAVSVIKAGSKGALLAGVFAFVLALWTVVSQ